MDAAAELGRNPVKASTRFSLSMEMSRLMRDGTAEPVSRDQILRHARGQGNVHFPCSADHEQDWQPYPVDPYSAICDDHTYIHTYKLLRQTPRSTISIFLFLSHPHFSFKMFTNPPPKLRSIFPPLRIVYLVNRTYQNLTGTSHARLPPSPPAWRTTHQHIHLLQIHTSPHELAFPSI